MEPIFFESPDAFRAWLDRHHETETEVLVGFWKTATGKPSLTWSQSVDQALCFGWIDGVRRSLGADAYTIRFTPRKARSNWSAVNIAKVEELAQRGLMRPAGVAAFALRTNEPGSYSFERDALAFSPDQEKPFREAAEAWTWFTAQAPSYQKAAIHWVTSAKRAETQHKRLAELIADSAAGLRVKPLRRP